jgi:hypothetical protein
VPRAALQLQGALVPREGKDIMKGEEIIRLPWRGQAGQCVGLQLRVRFVPAALLAVLMAALALRCVSKARDRTGHVGR